MLRDELIVHRACSTKPGQEDISYRPQLDQGPGVQYLVAIMDWYSRRVLAWRVSNTLDTDLYRGVEELYSALKRRRTDQGSQSPVKRSPTCSTTPLRSVDGKGRWVDNVFVERLWRSVRYEDVYLRAYETPTELQGQAPAGLRFLQQRRRHSDWTDAPPMRCTSTRLTAIWQPETRSSLTALSNPGVHFSRQEACAAGWRHLVFRKGHTCTSYRIADKADFGNLDQRGFRRQSNSGHRVRSGLPAAASPFLISSTKLHLV